MSHTKTIEEIRELRQTSAALDGFHELYETKYRHDSHCDKKGFGFSQDDRFRAFKIQTGFDSWRGYFGNSSCSSILNVNSDIAQKYFIKALEAHQRELFATAARLMREEAARLTDKAAAELQDMQDMLDDAKADAVQLAAE